MKTIKSITAIAFLFATTMSEAHLPSSEPINNEGKAFVANTIHQPFFRKAGDKLYVNFFNENMGKVQIKVLDSENRLVFKEILTDKLVVEKAFNFSKAVKDHYTVVITDENDTYLEYYVVK